ncbi:unnamed protein product [Polarella glacialis]|uniref:Uncharacterized protein n=1 Tax=Polarella glacialis TaxID=89957 RepID=A0A813JJX8_POLGL|nr:unnamed protein product [Polarella glacialis]
MFTSQVSPCSPLGARETGSSTPAHGSVTPIPCADTIGLYCAAMANQLAVLKGCNTFSPVFMRLHGVRSPFSDSSQERLLPKNLLGSDPNSSRVSDAMSPTCQSHTGPWVQFQGSDVNDRWVCIPSGIVERHKAQFDSVGSGPTTLLQTPAALAWLAAMGDAVAAAATLLQRMSLPSGAQEVEAISLLPRA